MITRLSRKTIIQNAITHHRAALDFIQAAEKVIEKCRPVNFLTSIALERTESYEVNIPLSCAVDFALATEGAVHKQILDVVRDVDKVVREDLVKASKPRVNIHKLDLPRYTVVAGINHSLRGEQEGLWLLKANIVDLSNIISKPDKDEDYTHSENPLRNGQIEISDSSKRAQWFFDDLYYFAAEYVCHNAMEVIKDLPKYKDPLAVIREFKSWATLHAAGKQPFSYCARRRRPYSSLRALATLQS
jgi:hypothetical protein